MDCSISYQISQWLVAVGTISAVIVAIWGDTIRAKLWSPKMSLHLCSQNGELTRNNSGQQIVYYHLKITNQRPTSPAKKVQVLCKAVFKGTIQSDDFKQMPLTVPLQLTWSYPDSSELLPTVGPEKTCDLGVFDPNQKSFCLSTYVTPNNFEAFIRADKVMRVHLQVVADNYTSGSTHRFEISWDGQIPNDLNNMSKHLTIKELSEKN